MKDLYTSKNVPAFLLLAPFVCFVTAVLLPVSVLGLLLVVPGLLGLAGLAGLLGAWVGLLFPGFSGRFRAGILIGLMLGLGAAALGSVFALAWLGDRANPARYAFAAALPVYALLAALFLRALAQSAPGEGHPRSWSRHPGIWVTAAVVVFAALCWKPLGPFPMYRVIAGVASGYFSHQGRINRALRSNAFAVAICAGRNQQLAEARNMIGRDAPELRDTDALHGVIRSCLWTPTVDPRDGLTHPAIWPDSVPVMLDAIVESERLNGVDSRAGCTDLQSALLQRLAAEHDAADLQAFTDRGLRTDCAPPSA